MTTNPADRARSLAQLEWLNRLFDLPASAREAELAALAARDAGLAEAVRELLSSADAIDGDDGDDGAPLDPQRLGPDSLIGGRFRLLRPLGSGGMGEVFLAQRTDEIEQYVAIKLLHEGGRAMSRARARREQQILARLSHPNIAGLIDAGVSESGRPWFAMDYVDGERLIAWCDGRRSNVADRVRRFVHICNAVQFAHKNLILHRDLKPSNILIDNEGVPKLLDFGIAKVIDANDTDQTRTLALTPAYAAPEQLRGEPATTASDVYQLGSVLYELLSGVPVQQARSAAARDADGLGELPRPHQALATRIVGDRSAAEQAACARGESPDRLVRLLKGDLGNIVAKATAARPAERYDTAQALADDLERWLAGLPVRAHRPSLAYSFGKLLRRHAWAAAAIVLLSLGLVAATVIAFDKAASERHQREQAEAQRREAEQQRDLARSQRERSEAMVGFLRSVFRQANPDVQGHSELMAPELLSRALAALDQRVDVDDLTRAELLTEVASAFANLGQPQTALAPAERAVELMEPHREQHAAEYLNNLGVLLTIQNFLGRYQDQLDRATRALPLARSVRGDGSDTYAALLWQRSFAFSSLGKYAEAEDDARTALDHLNARGETDSDDVLEALSKLAVAASYQSNYPVAQAALRRIIALEGRNPPIAKSNLLTAKMNLAVTLYDTGETDAAIELLEPTLKETEAMVGVAHLGTLAAKMLLTQSYLAAGDPQRARPLFDQLQAVLPAAGAQFARAQGYAANGMLRYELATGRFGDALRLARDYLEKVPEGDPADLRRRNDIRRLLGEAQLHLGQPANALSTFEAVLSEVTPGEIARRAVLEDGIGRARLAEGDTASAIESLRRAAEDFRRIQAVDKADILRSEIHELWARALATKDPQFLDRLQEKRIALVAALGGEDKLQVWQLDRLLDDLSRHLGRSGIDVERRTRAEAGLRRAAGASKPPAYVGLSEF